uniref:MORN-repeat protein n=1 Tax=viral metagenome TaxID=1070528 RepID=A0A6C0EC90_9ZZZZ
MTLIKILEICKIYIEDPSYVYKKCNNCIVILKKIKDTLTNESRDNVVDKKYAKFRANKLYVEKIISCDSLEELKQIKNSIHKEKELNYIVGEIVEVENFDKDINIICSRGIHYFMTIEQAYYYAMDLSNFTGEYKHWYENGVMMVQYNLIDGKLNGLYRQWHYIGQIFKQCEYINGKKNGKFYQKHYNGETEIECEYIDDVYHGKYESWHINGVKSVDAEYNYGKCKFYNAWNEKGKPYK